jgi:hypothetical protein
VRRLCRHLRVETLDDLDVLIRYRWFRRIVGFGKRGSQDA